jgi:hypothetical protein
VVRLIKCSFPYPELSRAGHEGLRSVFGRLILDRGWSGCHKTAVNGRSFKARVRRWRWGAPRGLWPYAFANRNPRGAGGRGPGPRHCRARDPGMECRGAPPGGSPLRSLLNQAGYSFPPSSARPRAFGAFAGFLLSANSALAGRAYCPARLGALPIGYLRWAFLLLDTAKSRMILIEVPSKSLEIPEWRRHLPGDRSCNYRRMRNRRLRQPGLRDAGGLVRL